MVTSRLPGTPRSDFNAAVVPAPASSAIAGPGEMYGVAHPATCVYYRNIHDKLLIILNLNLRSARILRQNVTI